MDKLNQLKDWIKKTGRYFLIEIYLKFKLS